MTGRVKALDRRKLIAAIPEAEILSSMPPVLRSIADASSVDAALKLGTQYGGSRFHFPSTAHDDTRLAQCVGELAARGIVAVFGGTYVEMPTLTFLKKLIVKHSAAPAGRLAVAIGITERYVRCIRAEQRGDAKAPRKPAGAREGRGAIPLPENR